MSKIKNKDRSVFSIENFRGLDSENKKVKVASNKAVEMSNLSVESEVLKTRPSLKFKKRIFGLDNVEIIDYYNMYYEEEKYHTIYVTTSGFYFYDSYYNSLYSFDSNQSDGNVKIITNLENLYIDSSLKPFFQQEKKCLFVFCLDEIYVISFFSLQSRNVWFLYKLSDKIKEIQTQPYDESEDIEKCLDYLSKLPEPYIPLVASCGDTLNAIDDINMISNKRKYSIFEKYSTDENGYYIYDLPSDYVEENNDGFTYDYYFDDLKSSSYCVPIFSKIVSISSVTTSDFPYGDVKITFLDGQEYSRSEFLALSDDDKKDSILEETIILDVNEIISENPFSYSFNLSKHKVLFSKLKNYSDNFYNRISENLKNNFNSSSDEYYIVIPMHITNGSTAEDYAFLILYCPLKTNGLNFEQQKIEIVDYDDDFSNVVFYDDQDQAITPYGTLTSQTRYINNSGDFNEAYLINYARSNISYKSLDKTKEYVKINDFVLEEPTTEERTYYYPSYTSNITNEVLENKKLSYYYDKTISKSNQIFYTDEEIPNPTSITSISSTSNSTKYKIIFSTSKIVNADLPNEFSDFISQNGNSYENSNLILDMNANVEVVNHPENDYYVLQSSPNLQSNFLYKKTKPSVDVYVKDILQSLKDNVSSTDISGDKIVFFKSENKSIRINANINNVVENGNYMDVYVYMCLIANFNLVSETFTNGTQRTRKARVGLLFNFTQDVVDSYNDYKVEHYNNIMRLKSSPVMLNLYSNDYSPANLVISYTKDDNYKTISECKIGINFGIENRLILAGNSKYPNIDRYNISNDILNVLDESQSYELTYFPSTNRDVVGGLGKINGFSIASDNVMYITKEYYPNDSKLFVRSRNVSDDGIISYFDTRTSIDKTVLNENCFKRFINDSVMLTKDGLFGIELTENYASNKRLIKARDSNIKSELSYNIKECENPYITVFGNNLFIVLNNIIYVADYRLISEDREGSMIYDFVKWIFDYPIKQMKVLDDVLELRLANDNIIYEFSNDSEDEHLTKVDVWQYYGVEGVNANFNYLYFGDNQLEDYGNYYAFFVNKTSGKTFIKYFNDNPILYPDDKKWLFRLYSEYSSPFNYGYGYILEYKPNSENIESIGHLTEINYTNCDLFLIHKKKINFYYKTTVLDFGSPLMEKSMFDIFFYSNRLENSNIFNIAYRTMRGYNELMDNKTFNSDNNINFDLIDFSSVALNSFTEFGAKKNLKINNFLYAQFAFTGEGKIEINSIKILYKNNRMLKTTG